VRCRDADTGGLAGNRRLTAVRWPAIIDSPIESVSAIGDAHQGQRWATALSWMLQVVGQSGPWTGTAAVEQEAAQRRDDDQREHNGDDAREHARIDDGTRSLSVSGHDRHRRAGGCQPLTDRRYAVRSL
jgi:hypothetical protein